MGLGPLLAAVLNIFNFQIKSRPKTYFFYLTYATISQADDHAKFHLVNIRVMNIYSFSS